AAYFVFDLANVSQTITGAQFNLFNPAAGYHSSDTSETFRVGSVSTAIATLEADGSNQFGVNFALTFGSQYATKTISAANNNQIISTVLSASAVTALNGKRGSQIALGASLSTASGSADQLVFAGTNGSEARQLVLTYADLADWYSFNVTDATAPLI